MNEAAAHTNGWWLALQLLSPFALAFVGFAFRGWKKALCAKVEKVEDSVGVVKREVASAKLEIEALRTRSDRIFEALREDLDTKVSDEEWIRESMKLRNDVQDLGRTLARIEGKTDSTLMVATGVNRLAAAIEKKVEEPNG